MSTYAYDPDNWLVSAHRKLQAYTRDSLQALDAFGTDVQVEMSFPDTSAWQKTSPLNKVLVHIEQMDEEDPVLGFGTPGVEEYNEVDGTYRIREAAWHKLHFNVGVWVSAEMGGGSKRMETVQALKNLFGPAGARRAFNVATDGLQVVSFEGGNMILDTINDLPVWRVMDMILVISVFSRHDPPSYDTVPLDYEQGQHLKVVNQGGTYVPAETP